MKITIDKELCIGCGTCEALAPDVFSMNEEGKAELKKGFDEEKNKDAINQTVETCPVNAVKVE